MEDRIATGLGIKRAFEKIAAGRDTFGTSVNGWRITYSGFGDRADYNGNWLERAVAAYAGIFGNRPGRSALSAGDDRRQRPEARRGEAQLYAHVCQGRLPAVANAFWSVTMYDGKTQLLIENPINRYLINSPMLPDMKKNPDGSVTLYIQKDSPGTDKESNWLPAPDGPIYMVMRLYWPKPEVLDGGWKPPAIVAHPR